MESCEHYKGTKYMPSIHKSCEKSNCSMPISESIQTQRFHDFYFLKLILLLIFKM